MNVYESGNLIDAELIKSMLLENEIDAVVVSKIDTSLYFGVAKVFCSAADEENARKIISTNPTDSND